MAMTHRELLLQNCEVAIKTWQKHLRAAQNYAAFELAGTIPAGVEKPRYKLATCEERLAKWVAKRLTLSI
jgi:hypothetical protein